MHMPFRWQCVALAATTLSHQALSGSGSTVMPLHSPEPGSLHIAAGSKRDFNESQWVPTLNALISGSTQEFQIAANPLAIATYLSYTSTSGSYYNASDANRTINGWVRDPVDANPPGGMRAIAFTSGARGIIVFRGTDLNTTGLSGQADNCADGLLFGGKLASQLPAYCKAFSPKDLDYFAAALEFTKNTLVRHSGVEFAFTGHSLGAGLATLVASAIGGTAPAIVFSSPPVRDNFLKLLGQAPAVLNITDRVLYLANSLDPVYHEAASLAGLPGRVCTWPPPATPSLACDRCFENQPGYLHREELACSMCFQQEHVYSTYFYKLLPGPRPSCGAVDVGPRYPQPTLRAQRGRTPQIDGVLSAGEWGDAFSLKAVLSQPLVQCFKPIGDPQDWSLEAGWIKFDSTHLYFAFDIDDDIAYGTDTASWQPSGNPDARLLNRTGWPWFGDEMEVLLNTMVGKPCVDHKCGVVGNASQWQMVINTIKSRLGGYGVGGLMEGEPRNDNGTAWKTYTRWIESGIFRGATSPRPHRAGLRHGYQIEWAIAFSAIVLPGGDSFDPLTAKTDVAVGINFAFGDVDTPTLGDSRYGLRHETWISGERGNRTATDEFATLWLLV